MSIRDRFEYCCFLTAVKISRCLPTAFVLWKLKLLFYLFGYLGGIRKRIVTQQLRLCFPELTKAETTRLVRKTYSELATTTAEVFIFSDKYLTQRTQFTGFDYVHKALALGRGLIVVSAHFSNWELGAKMLAREFSPVYGIVKKQRNKLFNAYIDKTRLAAGLTTIDMKNAVKHIVSALRKNQIVAILVDQYAGRHGVEMDFMGHPTQTYTSVAQLALKYHTPIIVAFDIRDEQGQHNVTFHSPLVFDNIPYSEDNVINTTKQINSYIEEQIRTYPHLYFWVHKKWRK